MKRFVILFCTMFFCVSGAKALSIEGGLDYRDEYADTILANYTPSIDLNQFPELHPGTISASSRYDIQPIVHRSFKTMVFVVFIICIMIFLLVKFLYPDYYAASVEGFISTNFFNQSIRVTEYGGNIPFILMVFFRCLVISLGILLVVDVLHIQEFFSLEKVYFTILLIIILGTIIKNVAEYGFNFMAGTIQQTRPYFIQVNILYNVMCMLLLPILLILFFENNLTLQMVKIVGYSWLTISVILYLIRSVQVVSAKSIISYLHFILYLCAFEIVPWLLIARIVWNETNT